MHNEFANNETLHPESKKPELSESPQCKKCIEEHENNIETSMLLSMPRPLISTIATCTLNIERLVRKIGQK